MYEISKTFPKSEQFGLTSQLRRASSSVPMNIAEGSGYETDKEMGRYLKFSAGSVSEVEYCLILAKDLKYIDETDYRKYTQEAIAIRKMIYKFKLNF